MFENMTFDERPTAWIEIFILMLVAFLIGYVFAWWFYRSKYNKYLDSTKEIKTFEVNPDDILKYANEAAEDDDTSQADTGPADEGADPALEPPLDPHGPAAEELELLDIVNFASTYFVGTRVIKPLLANLVGKEDQIANPDMHWNRWFPGSPGLTRL